MKRRTTLLGALGIAAILLFTGCGERALEERPNALAEPIIGGMPSPLGAWPNVVWLEDASCTGILLSERLVVYAAHCGTEVGTVVAGNTLNLNALDEAKSDARTSVTPELCVAHPEFRALGDGNDLAFCTLREPFEGVVSVPVAVGCERERVGPGAESVLVGFGIGDDGAEVGVKRDVTTPLVAQGLELEIGDAETGSCDGDSGGPAFFRVDSGTGAAEWRLVGVLSSGVNQTCGRGYYTDLSKFVAWLETESEVDVTPCVAGGAWQPSPACVVPALDERGVPLDPLPDATPSATCGAPAEPIADSTPPDVALRADTAQDGSGAWRATIDVTAVDDESGVRTVLVELVDPDGVVEATRVDEIAPYRFEVLAVGRARQARATASDFRGNRATALVALDLPAVGEAEAETGGCQLGRSAPGAGKIMLVTALVWLFSRPRDRRKRMPYGCFGARGPSMKKCLSHEEAGTRGARR